MNVPILRALAASVLALSVPTALAAIDLPTMKPGLWETQVTRDGAPSKSPAPATRMCIDSATQKEMMDMGMGAAARRTEDQHAFGDGRQRASATPRQHGRRQRASFQIGAAYRRTSRRERFRFGEAS